MLPVPLPDERAKPGNAWRWRRRTCRWPYPTATSGKIRVQADSTRARHDEKLAPMVRLLHYATRYSGQEISRLNLARNPEMPSAPPAGMRSVPTPRVMASANWPRAGVAPVISPVNARYPARGDFRFRERRPREIMHRKCGVFGGWGVSGRDTRNYGISGRNDRVAMPKGAAPRTPHGPMPRPGAPGLRRQIHARSPK